MTVEPRLNRPISSPRARVGGLSRWSHRQGVRGLRGVTSPAQTVSMEATLMAPTSTMAMGPKSVSNRQARRSLRANRPGTVLTVKGATENRRPGTYTDSRRVPFQGMWMR